MLDSLAQLGNAGGSLVYHLTLALLLAGGAVWIGKFVPRDRGAARLWSAALLHALGAGAAALIVLNLINGLVLLATLDRAIAFLTLLLMGGALMGPASRGSGWTLAAATVVVLGLLSWGLLAGPPAAGYYSGSVQDGVWTAVHLGGVLLVAAELAARRPAGWVPGVLLLGPLAAALLAHWAWPLAGTNGPAPVVLAEMLIWPIWMVWLAIRQGAALFDQASNEPAQETASSAQTTAPENAPGQAPAPEPAPETWRRVHAIETATEPGPASQSANPIADPAGDATLPETASDHITDGLELVEFELAIQEAETLAAELEHTRSAADGAQASAAAAAAQLAALQALAVELRAAQIQAIERSQLEAQLEAAVAQVQVQARVEAELNSHLAAANKRAARLREVFREARLRLRVTTQALAETQANIARLEQAHGLSQNDLSRLAAERDAAGAEAARLSEQIAELRGLAGQQRQAVEAAEQKATALAAQMTELQARLATTQRGAAEGQQLEAELQNVAEMVRHQTQLATGLHGQLESARQREQALRQAFQTAHSQLQRVSADLKLKQEEAGAAQTALTAAQAELETLTQQLQSARGDIRWLSDQLDEAQRTAAFARAEAAALAGQSSALQEERDCLHEQLATMHRQLQERTQHVLALQTHVQSQAQQIAAMRREMKDVQPGREAQQSDLQATQAGLEKLAQQNQSLTRKAEADLRAFGEARQAWAKAQAELQRALDSAQQQERELRAALDATQVELLAAMQQNRKLSEQLTADQKTLAETQTAWRAAQVALDRQSAMTASARHQLEQKERVLLETRVELKKRTESLRAAQREQRPELAADAVESEGEADNGGTSVEGMRHGHHRPGPAGQVILGDYIQDLSPKRPPLDQLPVAPPVPPARPAQPTGMRPDLVNAARADMCPHLGLAADPDTHHAFASTTNRCFALTDPLEVTPSHQDGFCLCADHTACPVFTGAQTAPRLPIDTLADPHRRRKPRGLAGLFRPKPE